MALDYFSMPSDEPCTTAWNPPRRKQFSQVSRTEMTLLLTSTARERCSVGEKHERQQLSKIYLKALST